MAFIELVRQDNAGGATDLIVSGDMADALSIAGSVAADEIRGTNLQLQYVSEATQLSDLNYGRGVGTGNPRKA